MFDLLKSMFSDDAANKVVAAKFASDDLRLAEAVLMFHVMQADGVIVDKEGERMNKILTREYDLSQEQLDSLLVAAQDAENEAVDLYRFTSLLKNELDQEQLIQIVENLWEMVFADGELHELEDNVVWRIAELLNVQSRERMELKRRVRDRRGV